MRTVVFGAPGQLGRDLCPLLPGDVISLNRGDADVTDSDAVRAKLLSLKPDRVINCAAYNLVDKAEQEPAAAFAVNTWGVRTIAETCRELDATLIHFSTDYVFGLDQSRREPFGETDAPGPVSVYGLSKLAGEYLVRSICPKHFVIRTCGLYGVWGSGGKGGNFVETMLRLAGQNKPLRVVNDQRCTPSFTADVASASAALIETAQYGLCHVTNAGDCTWYELASEIFRVSGIEADLSPITSAEFNAPAKRPAFSVLSNNNLREAGVAPPRPWQQALAAYLEARNSRTQRT